MMRLMKSVTIVLVCCWSLGCSDDRQTVPATPDRVPEQQEIDLQDSVIVDTVMARDTARRVVTP
jgi:hypothetical protein